MSTRWAVRSLAVMSLSIVTVTAGYVRPHFVECVSNDECGLDYCCRLGTGRFSIPKCMMRGAKGDICRPHAEPKNVTLTYPGPDGSALPVKVTDVYYLYCPCQFGLTCLKQFHKKEHIPKCGVNKYLFTNQLDDDGIPYSEED